MFTAINGNILIDQFIDNDNEDTESATTIDDQTTGVILTQAGQLVTTLQEWVLSQMRKRMIVSKLAGQAKSIDQPCKKAMWRRPKAI